MLFTYDAYRKLLQLLKAHNYKAVPYSDWGGYSRTVILRHDIDNDIEKAIRIVEIEKEENVSSTYFVLLTSDFYNVFSDRNAKLLQKITDCGHEIGLHFDEVRYQNADIDELKNMVLREARILSDAVGTSIKTVSMHRPSKMMIDADLVIPGIINIYGKTYFKEFKYLSDSRRRWREPVEEIIASEEFDRLHILTHAFWYNDEDQDIHDSVKAYVNHANIERYCFMQENITDIGSIMKREEILS